MTKQTKSDSSLSVKPSDASLAADHAIELATNWGTQEIEIIHQRQEQSGEQLDVGGEPISRSQRKREAGDITRLGQVISELPERDLQKLPLEERVRNAVDELREIRTHGARKRQLLYLGKVLRKTELEPIRLALTALRLSANTETRLFHQTEQWRDRLLSEGDSALSEFIDSHPSADRQRLRNLLRKHKAQTDGPATQTGTQSGTAQRRGVKSAREVFKLVRTVLLDAAKT